jgi:cytochrome c biogenesis protein CcmG/thiol:disulfide interchange protein DsbE
MHCSVEETATAAAPPAQMRPSKVGKTWRFLAAVGVAAGLLALLAWGLTRDPKLIPSPLIGREAPLFALELFDGGTWRLEEQRGNVVVLNVWASWCYPACWNEAPRLEAAGRRYRDQGIVLVGLNYQDREAEARAFIQRFGKTFPNGPDTGSKIAIAYAVYGVPETFFIDHAGWIYAKHIGEISWETLEAKIEGGWPGGGHNGTECLSRQGRSHHSVDETMEVPAEGHCERV